MVVIENNDADPGLLVRKDEPIKDKFSLPLLGSFFVENEGDSVLL